MSKSTQASIFVLTFHNLVTLWQTSGGKKEENLEAEGWFLKCHSPPYI